MSYQIDEGNFDINSTIGIIGNFTEWENSIVLTPIEDERYSTTISTFQAGDDILFKFRIGDDGWEQPNPEICECVDDGFGSYNRIYTVQDGTNILEYWFSDDNGSTSEE